MDRLPDDIIEYIWRIYYMKYIIKLIPIVVYLKYRTRAGRITNHSSCVDTGYLMIRWGDLIDHIKILRRIPYMHRNTLYIPPEYDYT